MELGAFMEHSGAVLIVIVFLVIAIGVTLLLSTSSSPAKPEHPADPVRKD